MVISSVTARVIANFAWQHLKAATLFRDRVIALELVHQSQPFGSFFEEIRSYASGGILSAVASLEALINELFIAHNGRLRAQIPSFGEAFWGKKGIERKPILDKYQYALKLINASPLEQHSDLYRETWALIELRNALVHFKPTWDPEKKRQIELREVLTGKFPVSSFLAQAQIL